MDNWINIKEKMPEQDKKVLFYSQSEPKGFQIFIGYWTFEYINSDYTDRVEFYTHRYGPMTDEDAENITYWHSLPHQPERSKREDSQKCEMRCSEHCGNTVRDK